MKPRPAPEDPAVEPAGTESVSPPAKRRRRWRTPEPTAEPLSAEHRKFLLLLAQAFADRVLAQARERQQQKRQKKRA